MAGATSRKEGRTDQICLLQPGYGAACLCQVHLEAFGDVSMYPVVTRDLLFCHSHST